MSVSIWKEIVMNSYQSFLLLPLASKGDKDYACVCVCVCVCMCVCVRIGGDRLLCGGGDIPLKRRLSYSHIKDEKGEKLQSDNGIFVYRRLFSQNTFCLNLL